MANVQKRKEEIFKKRQEELKAKLKKKETKIKMLSDFKVSTTPTKGEGYNVRIPTVSEPVDTIQSEEGRPDWTH